MPLPSMMIFPSEVAPTPISPLKAEAVDTDPARSAKATESESLPFNFRFKSVTYFQLLFSVIPFNELSSAKVHYKSGPIEMNHLPC